MPKKIKLSTIKLNPNNPRLVKDDRFFKLCKSIEEFGVKMMPLRPIVIDENNIILGGNMRFKALKELGYKEIPEEWIKKASELTEEEKQEFIIKDNIGFGSWDWDSLANEWDSSLLDGWGLDVPQFSDEPDYSILDDDDDDLTEDLQEMTEGVKKAIQIEFNFEHYEEAYELVKFWRERGAYIGGMIMEYLRTEKEKL